MDEDAFTGITFAPEEDEDNVSSNNAQVNNQEPVIKIDNSLDAKTDAFSGITFAPSDIDIPASEPMIINNTLEEAVDDPDGTTEIEVDARLQEIYERDIATIREEAKRYEADAVEGGQDAIDRYNIMVETAKKEDEITGDQRAALIPKPESLDRVQRLEEERLKNYQEKLENVQRLLDDPNPIRRAAVEQMVGAGADLNTINYVAFGADFVPIVGTVLGVVDIPNHVRQANALFEEGNYGQASLLIGASLAELVGVGIGTKVVTKKIAARARKLTGLAEQMDKIESATKATVDAAKTAARKVASENKDKGQRLINEYQKSTGKTVATGSFEKKNLVLDPALARIGGREIADTVMELQQDVAGRYAAIDKNPVGNTELKNRRRQEVFNETGISEEQAFTGLTEDVDEFVSPLLNPDKFDSIVAIAVEFEKKNPGAFKDPNKSIIDSLFELTVQDKLVDSQELTDMLAKYALNFDDYVLTVVGSGSEAGKILNKLSQIRRAGSLDSIAKAKQRKMEQGQNYIVSTWRRIENVRRGGMVSMVKTAARNLQSATIRSPMEALENVMDTTLVNMSQEFNRTGKKDLASKFSALKTGGKSLVSGENWKGSTAALKRIYATPVQTKELTDFLLKRPEFTRQYEALFDNVNEYQVATGRGSGGVTDAVLSRAEDVVNALNVPNRIQEYVIRRGTFIGELERLVKREYGIDLVEALEKGSLTDLMANSSKVRPKGAATFAELVEDSTRRALDVTYAKAPDIPVFNDIANFLTRTGLTAFTTPFPRFMFNSMELMGQYSGGAFKVGIEKSIVNKVRKKGLIDKLAKANKELKVAKNPTQKAKITAQINSLEGTLENFGELTRKDRQNISRNISGLVAFTAAYQYRTSGNDIDPESKPPSNYKLINSTEGKVIDTTAQFPMRQFLWMAEAVKRLSPAAQKFFPQAYVGKASSSLMGRKDEGLGTFMDWFDAKEAQETFLGTSARSGASNVFIEEIAGMLSGQDDLSAQVRASKAAGRSIGDYLTTWAIPITQIVELQRVQGDRPSDYTDESSDEVPTILGEIKRSARQRGISNLFNPSSEFEKPAREFLYSPERNREGLGLSLGAGITQFTKDEEYGEYLTNKGFTEYEVGTKSRIGSIRRAETKLLRRIVPTLVEVAKDMEAKERTKYRNLPSDDLNRKNFTEESYVNAKVVPYMTFVLSDARQLVRGAGGSEVEPVTLKLQEYMNLPKQVRRYGTAEYLKEFGTGPDLNDIEDITYMIEQGKQFKKATKLKK